MRCGKGAKQRGSRSAVIFALPVPHLQRDAVLFRHETHLLGHIGKHVANSASLYANHDSADGKLAAKYDVASVCVRPCDVRLAAKELKGTVCR